MYRPGNGPVFRSASRHHDLRTAPRLRCGGHALEVARSREYFRLHCIELDLSHRHTISRFCSYICHPYVARRGFAWQTKASMSTDRLDPIPFSSLMRSTMNSWSVLGQSRKVREDQMQLFRSGRGGATTISVSQSAFRPGWESDRSIRSEGSLRRRGSMDCDPSRLDGVELAASSSAALHERRSSCPTRRPPWRAERGLDRRRTCGGSPFDAGRCHQSLHSRRTQGHRSEPRIHRFLQVSGGLFLYPLSTDASIGMIRFARRACVSVRSER